MAKLYELLAFKNDTFHLDQTALAALNNAPGPFKLLSAVGDARLGKSSFMNALVSVWTELHGGDQCSTYNTLFQVGHTQEACTRGVWMTLLPAERGTYLILDVEGINLGNDAITTQLSLFTALISSEVMLFADKVLNNHAIQFLHHMARLKETEYANLQEADLALLRLILRDPHDAPPGMTLQECIVDGLTNPSKGDGQDEARTIIRKYFRQEQINVDTIPSVPRRDMSHNANWPVTDQDYAPAMRQIAGRLLNIPEKRTLHGASLDGPALVAVMQKLVATIKMDDWGTWISDWLMFETQLSRRAYEQFISPLLAREGTSAEIQAAIPAAMEGFRHLCVLPQDISKAETDLRNRVDTLQTQERNAELVAQRERDRIAAEEAAANIAALNVQSAQAAQQVAQLTTTVQQVQAENQHLRRKRKKKKFGLF